MDRIAYKKHYTAEGGILVRCSNILSRGYIGTISFRGALLAVIWSFCPGKIRIFSCFSVLPGVIWSFALEKSEYFLSSVGTVVTKM